MEEEKELQFQRLLFWRQLELRGIIAVMGPPYTMKTWLAQTIGRWAKCPALCIQHFFYPAAAKDCVMNKKKNEEVEQQAFTNLCNVAKFHFSKRLWPSINSTVVIKSRLNSTFELQCLLDLVTSIRRPPPLLIIECRFANEYLWKQHFEKVRQRSSKEEEDCGWYRPGRWEEMEKARDDYFQSATNLLNMIKASQNLWLISKS